MEDTHEMMRRKDAVYGSHHGKGEDNISIQCQFSTDMPRFNF